MGGSDEKYKGRVMQVIEHKLYRNAMQLDRYKSFFYVVL